MLTLGKTPIRRRHLITGQVQGVGFRPFVFRIAVAMGLPGFVCNTSDGVVIEIQGSEENLALFLHRLQSELPPLARLESLTSCQLPTQEGECGFVIRPTPSAAQPAQAAITVDTALCPACRQELTHPADRRFGHGLITCTDCGPRYTIQLRVPYDRHQTTMADFPMCPQCRQEYLDPATRRFHAQPIACHDCGPQLRFCTPAGETLPGDPLELARKSLRQGAILAVKGLGGFHLAVDAQNAQAVSRLRKAKKRDAKPFALLCSSLEQVRQLVELSLPGEKLLTSPASPILLAPRRADAPVAPDVAPDVAPSSHRLGVMLPTTPIQWLLMPPGTGPLVMTSANVSDEPMAIDNQDAFKRLGGLCDGFLLHDRAIARGVDDSVFIDIADVEAPELAAIPLRRARGFVPAPLELPVASSQPGLCMGGELKAVLGVVRGRQVVLSEHLGDLAHLAAYRHFQQAIVELPQLLEVQPCWIAHDLHPGYLGSQYARKLAAQMKLPTLAIQHHHAHGAAVLAEKGRSDRVLALICDGTGYGPDGTIWGGELLEMDLREFRRVAHLKPLWLPGGDAAARDIRRTALALLYQSLGEEAYPRAESLLGADLPMLWAMLQNQFRCVASSGAGRLFDAVACLLGISQANTFEGQAAMALESAAAGRPSPVLPRGKGFHLEPCGECQQLDFGPWIAGLPQRCGAQAGELAAEFHELFIQGWMAAIDRAVETTGLRTLAISGGVFANQRLTRRIVELASRRGLEVLRHEKVPPNDGGLALGQAAIAAAHWA